jgi:hypothetical protein
MKAQPIATPNTKQVKEAEKQHIKSMRVVKREIKQMLRDK